MHFLQALGACAAQKLRRISSKLSRIQAEIVKVFRRFRCKKHCRAQGNLRDLQCMHKMISLMFCPRSACVCGCDRADFVTFQREHRALSTEELRDFGATRARHTRGARTEAAHMHRTTCDTRLRLLCIFCRRWARVLRKNCVEFHRNFREFKRKS